MKIGYKKNKLQQLKLFCAIIEEGTILKAAEKMADTILGNKPLEVNNANVWVDPNWKNSQRKGNPERSVNNF